MDLPAHATKKSFQIFAGSSAAALLALLIPLYITGGTLPRPIERSTAPEELIASSGQKGDEPLKTVAEPEAPPLVKAVYTVEVFDHNRDPGADLEMTVERATAGNKRILLQVGGNWEVWTRAMDVFFAENEPVADALGRNFLIMKVNYSDANDNYEFLQKFAELTALPHFLILDPSGKLILSQPTEVFEKGNSYDEKALVTFFDEWATREPGPPAPRPESTGTTTADSPAEETAGPPGSGNSSAPGPEPVDQSGARSKSKTKSAPRAESKSKSGSETSPAPAP